MERGQMPWPDRAHDPSTATQTSFGSGGFTVPVSGCAADLLDAFEGGEWTILNEARDETAHEHLA